MRLLLLGLFSSLALLAQGAGPVVNVVTDPSGSCGYPQNLQFNMANQKLWGCGTDATWHTISGGGGGSGCTVSGSAGQIVYNNGSTGCSSSTATVTSGGAIAAASVSTGPTPPTGITVGTGGAWLCADGTPFTGQASGQSGIYCDATSNTFKVALNGSSTFGDLLAETATDSNTSHVLHATPNSAFGTFSAITSSDLPAQYKIWTCETGMGDGLNAITSATYLQSFCYNTTGVTVTLTGLKCYADAGTPTLNAAGNTLGALLTGAVTCTTGFAAGTQSANVLLTSGDYIKFTFVAGGTATQTTWVVTGAY